MARKRIERVKFNCEFCGNEAELKINQYEKRKRLSCKEKSCSNKAKGRPGELNGMYGKTHSSDSILKMKLKNSNHLKGKTYEQAYGLEKATELKQIRSKTFTKTWENPERVLSFLGKSHTKETKDLIAAKSSSKFTEEYYEKLYTKGIYTRPEDKSDLTIYSELSNWKRNMWYISKGQELLENGIWHPLNNNNGCVRDHIISRKHGFDNSVFPEILRHPENCQILLHRDNCSKASKNGFSLEELFDRIKRYKDDWFEQDLVLDLVQQYENGNRWKRKEVVSE